jgi:hypothetical protein
MKLSSPSLEEPAGGTLSEPGLGVRGGASIGAIVTGALVVLAAVSLFALASIAISVFVGFRPHRLPVGGMDAVGVRVAAGAGVGVLLAFLWGGYAAGRMARGAGWINGFFTAVVTGALLITGLAVVVMLRPGPGLDLHLPSGFPKVAYLVPRWVDALAAAAIAFFGATLGGAMGVHWHTKAERRATALERERVLARESFRDLREPNGAVTAEALPEISQPEEQPPNVGPVLAATTQALDPGLERV